MQEGYEIALDPQGSDVNVKQVWIRFGTLDSSGNQKWDRSMDLGPVAFNQGQKKTVVTVDDDQLPTSSDACYYQLLCEIDGEHGYPETLMTEPTFLM